MLGIELALNAFFVISSAISFKMTQLHSSVANDRTCNGRR